MKNKKISWVAVGNMLGLLTSAGVILDTLYVMFVKPLFTQKAMWLTTFGLGVLLFAIIVFCANLIYFEDKLKK